MWSMNTPMQLHARHIIDYDDAEGIDLNQAAADVAIFDVSVNGVIKFAALMITDGVQSDTTDGVIKFDIRPTAGSDTDRGDGDAGVITVPDGTAAGAVIYDESAKGQRVNAGEQIVVQYATAAADASAVAGHFIPILFIDPEFEMLENLGWTETSNA